jgi:1D-myo-inositol 3-kinase
MKQLLAGHYCHDTLIHSDATHRTLGGSAAYAGSILGPLGADFSVISKVGPDFLYADRVARPARVIAGALTTSFIDDYRTGPRVETLEAVCEPIRPDDISEDLFAEVAMACPIAGELSVATLERLRQQCRVLVCDVQGLIRVAARDGRVEMVGLASTPYSAALGSIDFLKVGMSELEHVDLESVRQRTRILLTREAQGCTLIDRTREIEIPPFRVAQIVDPTGAGDCFLAGFAFGLAEGWPVERAALFGNFCGSLAVGHVGLPRLARADFLTLDAHT